MGMTNCNSGDIAVIVSTTDLLRPILGRIVKVTSPVAMAGYPGWRMEERVCFRMTSNSWINCEFMAIGDWVYVDELPDSWLRPIRDQPGEDETLRIAGKPYETPTEIIAILAP